MFGTIGKLMVVSGLAIAATFASAPRDAAAAGSTGVVGDSGLARCFGAFGTGSAHFVSVQRPIVYAFNQHTKTVDYQRIRTQATLFRWNGSSWQVALDAGRPIQTAWKSEIVSDGQDKAIQLSGYTTFLGHLDIPANGYYIVVFDIRWDATNTVTVSGDRAVQATLFEENGADWLGPHSYCDYYPRAVEIDLGW